MSDTDDIYHGGFAGLLRTQLLRQRRFDGVEVILPAADVDLAPFFERILPPPAMPLDQPDRYSAQRKHLELQGEFQGQAEIHHLHALLIAISRRDDPPGAAVTLFHRIWAEHGTQMAAIISVRWMISTATTFSDIGQTGDQRAAGMGLSILFDMIKLHDSERRITGQPGRKPFRAARALKRFPLAFKMAPYGLKGGDLDRVMLARLWQLIERDATIRPLGMAMLRLVMTEPRSIFGRVQEIKKQAKAP